MADLLEDKKELANLLAVYNNTFDPAGFECKADCWILINKGMGASNLTTNNNPEAVDNVEVVENPEVAHDFMVVDIFQIIYWIFSLFIVTICAFIGNWILVMIQIYVAIKWISNLKLKLFVFALLFIMWETYYRMTSLNGKQFGVKYEYS